MQSIFYVFVAINYFALTSAARLAGECAMMCNDLRTDVLTLEMCRNAKRTLPRPKVGDFCSTAMEQGFSDACVALCMDQTPQHRVAQTCRAAAIEMPRPTVRKWCEHGYNVAFTKTVKDLKSHFSRPENSANEPHLEEVFTAPTDPVVAESNQHHERNTEHQAEREVKQEQKQQQQQQQQDQQHGSGLRGRGRMDESQRHEPESRGTAAVVATIPTTLDDATHDLVVREGQNAEEAVVEFCREHAAADVSTCIRELLSVVIEKLDEALNV